MAPRSGRGAAWLARCNGVAEVGGSNPLAPTILLQLAFSPVGGLVAAQRGRPRLSIIAIMGAMRGLLGITLGVGCRTQ